MLCCDGARRSGDVRLVFLGMKHPNPEVAEMDIGARTIRLADSLGLTGKHVYFNEQWVPYHERQNWLLDANCGVTTHYEHVETTFAFHASLRRPAVNDRCRGGASGSPSRLARSSDSACSRSRCALE